MVGEWVGFKSRSIEVSRLAWETLSLTSTTAQFIISELTKLHVREDKRQKPSLGMLVGAVWFFKTLMNFAPNWTSQLSLIIQRLIKLCSHLVWSREPGNFLHSLAQCSVAWPAIVACLGCILGCLSLSPSLCVFSLSLPPPDS